MLQGPLCMALFRKSKDRGSKPYIVGIVYPTEMKGDMTFTKFRSYALLEGRDIYAKKLLDRRTENRHERLPRGLLGGVCVAPA